MRLPLKPLFLTFLGIFSCAPSSADSQGWLIEQASDMYGEQISRISPEGLMTTFKDMNVGAVVKPPGWNVIVRNDRHKRFWEVSQKEYKERHTFRRSKPDERIVFRKTGEVKLAGIKAEVWTGYKSLLRPKTKGADKDGWIMTDEIRRIVYVTKEVNFPPQLSQYIGFASGMPAERGFPLRVVQINPKSGKAILGLDTVSIKKGKIPSSTFVLPKGYKKVEDEADVMLPSSEREEEIQSIFGSLSDVPEKKTAKPVSAPVRSKPHK